MFQRLLVISAAQLFLSCLFPTGADPALGSAATLFDVAEEPEAREVLDCELAETIRATMSAMNKHCAWPQCLGTRR